MQAMFAILKRLGNRYARRRMRLFSLFRQAIREKESEDDSTWQRPIDTSRPLTREERHEQIMAAYQ